MQQKGTLLRKLSEGMSVKKLLSRKSVRVWVCGCASGEEAYFIAILLQEYPENVKKHSRSRSLPQTKLSGTTPDARRRLLKWYASMADEQRLVVKAHQTKLLRLRIRLRQHHGMDVKG